MKIHQHLHTLPVFHNPVVTVGTFDGVHLGHQKIISRLKEIAARCQGESVVVTFDNHPRLVLHPDDDTIRLININQRKFERLAAAGIDHLVVLPFTPEFARTPWDEFIRHTIAETLKTKVLVVGYDHRFGNNREGSREKLLRLALEYHFSVEEVDELLVDGLEVSSTRIRKALNAGGITEANRLLGYEYSITGRVVRGNRIGHQIGFPTANIQTDDRYKLIAANGVYASRVEWNGQLYGGMSNIGIRPTINDNKFAVEVNIFDFNEEIYDECLTVYFVGRLRDEIRFASLGDLKQQIADDENKIRQMLCEKPIPAPVSYWPFGVPGCAG